MYNDDIYSIDDIKEDKKEFVIDTDSKAEWAINIIKQENKQKERLLKTIDEEINLLKSKKERILERDNTMYLKSKLYEYFLNVDSDFKNDLKTCVKYKLPSANLVLKKSKRVFEKDEKAIISYLVNNNLYDYLNTNYSIKWNELKSSDILDKVDGITEISTEERFEVEYEKHND